MYLPEREDLRRLMLTCRIKAADLARLSGVSKSTISKILNKPNFDPSFRVMKALFQALESASSIISGPISEIMSSKVITVQENEALETAKRKMIDNSISQLPALSSGQVVGLLTEAGILSHPHARVVREAMTYDYVVVGREKNWGDLRGLMASLQAVLVVEQGQLVGIATRADFLH